MELSDDFKKVIDPYKNICGLFTGKNIYKDAESLIKIIIDIGHNITVLNNIRSMLFNDISALKYIGVRHDIETIEISKNNQEIIKNIYINEIDNEIDRLNSRLTEYNMIEFNNL